MYNYLRDGTVLLSCYHQFRTEVKECELGRAILKRNHNETIFSCSSKEEEEWEDILFYRIVL